jgi:hypothetical protein
MQARRCKLETKQRSLERYNAFMAHGPEHGPAKKHAGEHGHEGGGHKAHGEHKQEAHHEAEAHHGKHEEWVSDKTAQTLLKVGITMYLGTALFLATGIPVPVYLIKLLGLKAAGAHSFVGLTAQGGLPH